MHIVLFSSSKVSGYSKRFEYAKDFLEKFLSGKKEITFLPFAIKDHISYTKMVTEVFQDYGVKVRSLHGSSSPKEDLAHAECIFVGGGNTFLLLQEIYQRDLLHTLKSSVQGGTPYMGVSAGSNVACKSIHTTNDMPIVYPPSFEALGFFPFVLNPHYMDPDPSSTHMGETREERIREFHEHHTTPVLGLREGAYIEYKDHHLTLGGINGGKIFKAGMAGEEIQDSSLEFLLL